jgi:hypothetical protein
MNYKINISFGIFIAHFIPGTICFIALFLCQSEFSTVYEWANEHASIFMLIAIVFSFAIGLILDATRYTITLVPKISACYRKWQNYDLSSINEEGTKIFDWIIENNFRFHQLYGNLAIALIVSLSVSTDHLPKYSVCLLWMLIVICIIASIFTYKNTVETLKERFPIKAQGGNIDERP